MIVGAGIPVGCGHAAEGVIAVVPEVAFFIHEAFANVDEVDDPDDEAVGPDLDGGVLGAFEGDGSIGDAGDFDFLGRERSERVQVEFAFAMGEGGGGSDHDFAEGFVDHVDDEFSCLADITGGILRGAPVFVTGGKGDDGWVGPKDVEERVGSGIGAPILIAGGDPGDGAWSHEGGEDAIAIAGGELFEIEGHWMTEKKEVRQPGVEES